MDRSLRYQQEVKTTLRSIRLPYCISTSSVSALDPQVAWIASDVVNGG